MPYVSVTRLQLTSLLVFPQFVWHSLASARQVRRAPGFLGGWLGGESLRGNWTATVWESADAMRAFRNRQSHLRAMPRLLRWCDEASFAHWEQADAAAPTGEMAHRRMASAGKTSKVIKPSARHVAGQTVGEKAPKAGPILRPR